MQLRRFASRCFCAFHLARCEEERIQAEYCKVESFRGQFLVATSAGKKTHRLDEYRNRRRHFSDRRQNGPCNRAEDPRLSIKYAARNGRLRFA